MRDVYSAWLLLVVVVTIWASISYARDWPALTSEEALLDLRHELSNERALIAENLRLDWGSDC
jgi:hypothetical protein